MYIYHQFRWTAFGFCLVFCFVFLSLCHGKYKEERKENKEDFLVNDPPKKSINTSTVWLHKELKPKVALTHTLVSAINLCKVAATLWYFTVTIFWRNYSSTPSHTPKKKKNLLSNQIKLFFKKGSHCVKYLLLLII